MTAILFHEILASWELLVFQIVISEVIYIYFLNQCLTDFINLKSVNNCIFLNLWNCGGTTRYVFFFCRILPHKLYVHLFLIHFLINKLGWMVLGNISPQWILYLRPIFPSIAQCQAQPMIWFILPAHEPSHVIKSCIEQTYAYQVFRVWPVLVSCVGARLFFLAHLSTQLTATWVYCTHLEQLVTSEGSQCYLIQSSRGNKENLSRITIQNWTILF